MLPLLLLVSWSLWGDMPDRMRITSAVNSLPERLGGAGSGGGKGLTLIAESIRPFPLSFVRSLGSFPFLAAFVLEG